MGPHADMKPLGQSAQHPPYPDLRPWVPIRLSAVSRLSMQLRTPALVVPHHSRLGSVHILARFLVLRRVKKNRPELVRKSRLPVKPVRTGSGLDRFQTGPNLKFKFEFKKIKNSQKLLKILYVATNLMVSKFFKYSFI